MFLVMIMYSNRKFTRILRLIYAPRRSRLIYAPCRSPLLIRAPLFSSIWNFGVQYSTPMNSQLSDERKMFFRCNTSSPHLLDVCIQINQIEYFFCVHRQKNSSKMVNFLFTSQVVPLFFISYIEHMRIIYYVRWPPICQKKNAHRERNKNKR